MSRGGIIALAGAAVAAGAVAAGWLFGTGSAQAEEPRPSPPGQVVGHETGQDPESVQKYWTPERQKDATPAAMPEAPGG
ncbi:MAG: hypothetical protein QOE54_3470 [Streptosporangiaceae bacterium]|jgi:hypothetical protein|nr:hypothetical protein [Streptosporangiaceae bacterium]MDX6431104.1 hypothetical protein [Streptosporangiaceae bacterium]